MLLPWEQHLIREALLNEHGSRSISIRIIWRSAESPKEKAKPLVSVGKVSDLSCVVNGEAGTGRIQPNEQI